jgi:hypothetical protein
MFEDEPTPDAGGEPVTLGFRGPIPFRLGEPGEGAIVATRFRVVAPVDPDAPDPDGLPGLDAIPPRWQSTAAFAAELYAAGLEGPVTFLDFATREPTGSGFAISFADARLLVVAADPDNLDAVIDVAGSSDDGSGPDIALYTRIDKSSPLLLFLVGGSAEVAANVAEAEPILDWLEARRDKLGNFEIQDFQALPELDANSLDFSGATGPGSFRTVAPEDAQTVALVYEAALDRDGQIDTGGLDFWIGKWAEGLSEEEISGFFLRSDEFREKFGDPDSLSNEALVERLYENILGRGAEAGGRQFWIDALEQGFSRDRLLLEFAKSGENRAGSPFVETLEEVLPGSWEFAGDDILPGTVNSLTITVQPFVDVIGDDTGSGSLAALEESWHFA